MLNPQRASLTLMYLQEGCSELVQASPDDCSRDVPCPPFMLICSLFSLPEADVCACVKRVCTLKGGHLEQESYGDRSERSGEGKKREGEQKSESGGVSHVSRTPLLSRTDVNHRCRCFDRKSASCP